jgi:hypothetical protein
MERQGIIISTRLVVAASFIAACVIAVALLGTTT